MLSGGAELLRRAARARAGESAVVVRCRGALANARPERPVLKLGPGLPVPRLAV
jgi:hypothetical protein